MFYIFLDAVESICFQPERLALKLIWLTLLDRLNNSYGKGVKKLLFLVGTHFGMLSIRSHFAALKLQLFGAWYSGVTGISYS